MLQDITFYKLFFFIIHYIHFIIPAVIAVKSAGGNKPNRHLPAQSQQQKQQNKTQNTLKDNNKGIRTTSLTSFGYPNCPGRTHSSLHTTAEFEQRIVGSEENRQDLVIIK